jgi:hypothetical protein
VNPDTLVVVHCYEGDAPNITGLLPWYLHHGCPVLILSPEDSPVKIDHPNVTCRSAGSKGWKGAHTILRQIEHWRITLDYPQKWFLLNDADSMCLSADLPGYLYEDPKVLWSNVITGVPNPSINYEPPYFVSQQVLSLIMTEADRLPLVTDAIDEFYVDVARALGLTVENYRDGYHAYTEPEMLYTFIKFSGIRMVHPVKRAEAARVYTRAYSEWKSRH